MLGPINQFHSWLYHCPPELVRGVDCGGLELRSFRPADKQELIGLHELILSRSRMRYIWSEESEDLDDVEAAYLQSGGELALGHVRGRLVAAGGLLRETDEHGVISRLGALEAGADDLYGRLMLEHLGASAEALGVETVGVAINLEWLPAQSLFEEAGYHRVGRREEGGFAVFDYLMAR